jgi:hypothetical protein
MVAVSFTHIIEPMSIKVESWNFWVTLPVYAPTATKNTMG